MDKEQTKREKEKTHMHTRKTVTMTIFVIIKFILYMFHRIKQCNDEERYLNTCMKMVKTDVKINKMFTQKNQM